MCKESIQLEITTKSEITNFKHPPALFFIEIRTGNICFCFVFSFYLLLRHVLFPFKMNHENPTVLRLFFLVKRMWRGEPVRELENGKQKPASVEKIIKFF